MFLGFFLCHPLTPLAKSLTWTEKQRMRKTSELPPTNHLLKYVYYIHEAGTYATILQIRSQIKSHHKWLSLVNQSFVVDNLSSAQVANLSFPLRIMRIKPLHKTTRVHAERGGK